MRSAAVIIALIFLTVLRACGTESASQDLSIEPPPSSSTSTTSATTPEPTLPWPVGPEFTADRFTLADKERTHAVTLISVNDTSFSLNLGLCGYGGNADFRIIEWRLIIDLGFLRESIGCPDQPADLVANGEVLQELFLSSPQIAISGDSITIENESTLLTLTTDDPTANALVAMTGVGYRGVSSSSAEIDPANVAVKFPAFFVVEVQLETCLAHGQVGGLQTEEFRDTVTAIRLDDCPAPTANDQAALDLFAAIPKLSMDGEQLTITSPNGTQLVLD